MLEMVRVGPAWNHTCAYTCIDGGVLSQEIGGEKEVGGGRPIFFS